jgi:hypothetical protein
MDATNDKAAVGREALVMTAEDCVNKTRKPICDAMRKRHKI